jgi:hypothetical protein
MGVKEKPDIIDIIERKRLQWYGHAKRMHGVHHRTSNGRGTRGSNVNRNTATYSG